jgi:zinc protease
MRTAAVITTLAASVAFATASPVAAPAQERARQPPPPVGAERPSTFPTPAVVPLDNGLTVFVVEDHRQPLVSATLMIPAAGASAHDPAKAGLAAMAAALLRQGTSTRSAQEIAQTIDQVGGTLSASAGADTTQASMSVVTSALDTGFTLLADIVRHPVFAEAEIARWRQQTLSNLKVAYADPEYLRDVAVERLAYGDHPYGIPTDGTPATVTALTAADVKASTRSITRRPARTWRLPATSRRTRPRRWRRSTSGTGRAPRPRRRPPPPRSPRAALSSSTRRRRSRRSSASSVPGCRATIATGCR